MADFFLVVIKKISQIVIFQNIRKYALIKTLKTGLKLPKIEILTPFYKISWKVDEIKCPYFLDLMHIWPCFRSLLLDNLLILKLIFLKNSWWNLFRNWCHFFILPKNFNLMQKHFGCQACQPGGCNGGMWMMFFDEFTEQFGESSNQRPAKH